MEAEDAARIFSLRRRIPKTVADGLHEAPVDAPPFAREELGRLEQGRDGARRPGRSYGDFHGAAACGYDARAARSQEDCGGVRAILPECCGDACAATLSARAARRK